MHIEVQHHAIHVDWNFRDHVKDRVKAALCSVETKVTGVTVRLMGRSNTAQQGFDFCDVHVSLKEGEPIIASQRARDLLSAINQASVKVARQIERRLRKATKRSLRPTNDQLIA